MALVRLSVDVAGLAEARRLGEQLPELVDPAPLATTEFEAPETGGWRVDAYFAEEPAPEQIAAAILAATGRAVPLRLEPVPDENWVAISQAALPPVPAGRFIVHGSHDRARIGRRLHAIEIDAGEAFGTAHHATTLGCLMAIDRMASRHSPARILDLGCGSGVLAIAAARVWPRARVTASDIDAVAIEVARANIVHNRLAHRIATVTATGFGHPALRSAAPFDLVLANILAGPLMLLAPAMRRAVAPGSVIALSGILSEQADAVRAYYGANGFRLEGRHLLNGWSILTLRRLA